MRHAIMKGAIDTAKVVGGTAVEEFTLRRIAIDEPAVTRFQLCEGLALCERDGFGGEIGRQRFYLIGFVTLDRRKGLRPRGSLLVSSCRCPCALVGITPSTPAFQPQ